MNEVRSNLTARGFSYTSNPQQADFVVGFSVGANDTTRTTVYTQRFRQVDIVGTAPDPIEVRSQDSTEGGLVIDIFDQASARKQSMGWVSKEITMSQRRDLQSTVREDHSRPLSALALNHLTLAPSSVLKNALLVRARDGSPANRARKCLICRERAMRA